jgi:hypothetical protein
MSDRTKQRTTGLLSAWTLGLTALVLVVMSGVALASGSSGGGTIHACVNKRTGVVRIVGLQSGAKCKTSERTLSWNSQGIEGATGASGPQGVAGVQGPQGVRGPQGATGPGASETSYVLELGQTEPLGTFGPFDFSTDCEQAGTEIANDINETNHSLVTIDETEMTPPSSIIVSPGTGIPPTGSASDTFETIASSSSAERHDEDTVTSPVADAGELFLTMAVGVNDCFGSLLWIPAASTTT